MSLERALREAARKERRDAIRSMVIGVVCIAGGALLCVVGSMWLGAIGVVFGLACVATGIHTRSGPDSAVGRVSAFALCALFGLASTLMIVTSLVAPDAWAWRSALVGIVVGTLGLALSGAAFVALLRRESRRRRATRPHR